MSCDDFRRRLSLGQRISGAMAGHLETCGGCRAMMDAWQMPEEELPAGLLRSVTESITSSLRPVRPLPSDAAMVLLCMALFFAFSVAVAGLFGFGGFQHLTVRERMLYYSVISICAAAFSLVTVQEIVPGSRKRIGPVFVVAGSIVVLAFAFGRSLSSI